MSMKGLIEFLEDIGRIADALEELAGRKADGTESDFTWETGIKHDASNSRPEFSKLMRDMNARVRADMAAKAAKVLRLERRCIDRDRAAAGAERSDQDFVRRGKICAQAAGRQIDQHAQVKAAITRKGAAKALGRNRPDDPHGLAVSVRDLCARQARSGQGCGGGDQGCGADHLNLLPRQVPVRG